MSLNLPRGYLSPSQIDTYQRCPRQYQFRYVEEKISPPGIALILGSSAHKACEHTHRYIAAHEEPAPTEEIEAIFADDYTERLVECKVWPDDKPGVAKDAGIQLVRQYNQTVAPNLWVTHDREMNQMIEYEVRAIISDVEMLGYVDLVDDDGHDLWIVDLKTSNRAKTQAQIDSSLQLSFYSHALGITRVRYENLITTKQPKIERLKSQRTQRDYRWLEQVVASVSQAISAGIFPPCSADSWCCSERWCGYWHLCRGAR